MTLATVTSDVSTDTPAGNLSPKEAARKKYEDACARAEKAEHEVRVAHELLEHTESEVEKAYEEVVAFEDTVLAEVRRRDAYASTLSSHRASQVAAVTSGNTIMALFHGTCHAFATHKAIRHDATLHRLRTDQAQARHKHDQLRAQVLERRREWVEAKTHLERLEERLRHANVLYRVSLSRPEGSNSWGIGNSSAQPTSRTKAEKWDRAIATWALIPVQFHNDLVIRHPEPGKVDIYFGFEVTDEKEKWKHPHGHVIVKRQTVIYRRMPGGGHGPHNNRSIRLKGRIPAIPE